MYYTSVLKGAAPPLTTATLSGSYTLKNKNMLSTVMFHKAWNAISNI